MNLDYAELHSLTDLEKYVAEYDAKEVVFPVIRELKVDKEEECKPPPVKKLIGQGTYGKVYGVTLRNKPYALKEIQLHREDVVPSFYEALFMKYAGRHGFGPELHAYEHCLQNGAMYLRLLMDLGYMDSPRLLYEYGVDQKFVKQYLKSVAELVHKCHNHGIVHMDLHAGNVMAVDVPTPGGAIQFKLKLIDFNFAIPFDLTRYEDVEVFRDLRFFDIVLLFMSIQGIVNENTERMKTKLLSDRISKAFGDQLPVIKDEDFEEFVQDCLGEEKLSEEDEKKYALWFVEYARYQDCSIFAKKFIHWKVGGVHPLVKRYGSFPYLVNRILRITRCIRDPQLQFDAAFLGYV